MAIFDDKTMEKASAGSSKWIKATDFADKGLTLQIVSTEKVKSQYGASAESGLVEREILEEGESFRYSFKDVAGNERTHDSTSFPLFIGMQNAEINFGDWLHITREGKGDKTRYSVEKVDAPVSQSKPSESSGTGV